MSSEKVTLAYNLQKKADEMMKLSKQLLKDDASSSSVVVVSKPIDGQKEHEKQLTESKGAKNKNKVITTTPEEAHTNSIAMREKYIKWKARRAAVEKTKKQTDAESDTDADAESDKYDTDADDHSQMKQKDQKKDDEKKKERYATLDVAKQILPGQCVLVFAPRGCGKTTLAIDLMQHFLKHEDAHKYTLTISDNHTDSTCHKTFDDSGLWPIILTQYSSTSLQQKADWIFLPSEEAFTFVVLNRKSRYLYRVAK